MLFPNFKSDTLGWTEGDSMYLLSKGNFIFFNLYDVQQWARKTCNPNIFLYFCVHGLYVSICNVSVVHSLEKKIGK